MSVVTDALQSEGFIALSEGDDDGDTPQELFWGLKPNPKARSVDAIYKSSLLDSKHEKKPVRVNRCQNHSSSGANFRLAIALTEKSIAQSNTNEGGSSSDVEEGFTMEELQGHVPPAIAKKKANNPPTRTEKVHDGIKKAQISGAVKKNIYELGDDAPFSLGDNMAIYAATIALSEGDVGNLFVDDNGKLELKDEKSAQEAWASLVFRRSRKKEMGYELRVTSDKTYLCSTSAVPNRFQRQKSILQAAVFSL